VLRKKKRSVLIGSYGARLVPLDARRLILFRGIISANGPAEPIIRRAGNPAATWVGLA